MKCFRRRLTCLAIETRRTTSSAGSISADTDNLKEAASPSRLARLTIVEMLGRDLKLPQRRALDACQSVRRPQSCRGTVRPWVESSPLIKPTIPRREDRYASAGDVRNALEGAGSACTIGDLQENHSLYEQHKLQMFQLSLRQAVRHCFYFPAIAQDNSERSAQPT